jgi:hypothetical protein
VTRASISIAEQPDRIKTRIAAFVDELDAAFYALLRRARQEGALDPGTDLRDTARYLTTTLQALNVAAHAGRSSRELRQLARRALSTVRWKMSMGSHRDSIPRKAAKPLLFASLAVAGSVLLAAWMGTLGFSSLTRAGVLAAAGLGGGLILRRPARVPGLPLIAMAIAAGSLLVAALLGGSLEATGGGVVFVTLLVATSARTRTSGLAAAGILAAAQILVAVF